MLEKGFCGVEQQVTSTFSIPFFLCSLKYFSDPPKKHIDVGYYLSLYLVD